MSWKIRPQIVMNTVQKLASLPLFGSNWTTEVQLQPNTDPNRNPGRLEAFLTRSPPRVFKRQHFDKSFPWCFHMSTVWLPLVFFIGDKKSLRKLGAVSTKLPHRVFVHIFIHVFIHFHASTFWQGWMEIVKKQNEIEPIMIKTGKNPEFPAVSTHNHPLKKDPPWITLLGPQGWTSTGVLVDIFLPVAMKTCFFGEWTSTSAGFF